MFVFYCRILPSFHSNWSKVKTSVKHYLTDILQVQFNIAIVLGYKCYGYMYSVHLYTELSLFHIPLLQTVVLIFKIQNS